MKTLSSIKEYFTPSEITTPRTNNFNIIRVFAAFMVIYGHMGTIMGTSVFALLGCAVSTLGVKILFTVSGYLITKSFLSDSHFGRYMIRRSFRIYPALFVLILFSALVAGPLLTTLPPRRIPLSPGHVGIHMEKPAVLSHLRLARCVYRLSLSQCGQRISLVPSR